MLQVAVFQQFYGYITGSETVHQVITLMVAHLPGASKNNLLNFLSFSNEITTLFTFQPGGLSASASP